MSDDKRHIYGAETSDGTVMLDIAVELRWAYLGQQFASLSDEDQADFLHEVVKAWEAIGIPAGPFQMAYVATRFSDKAEAREVRDWLDEFARTIDERLEEPR